MESILKKKKKYNFSKIEFSRNLNESLNQITRIIHKSPELINDNLNDIMDQIKHAIENCDLESDLKEIILNLDLKENFGIIIELLHHFQTKEVINILKELRKRIDESGYLDHSKPKILNKLFSPR